MLYPLSYGAMNCFTGLERLFSLSSPPPTVELTTNRSGNTLILRFGEQFANALDSVPRQARSHMRIQVGCSTHIRMA